jgi:hypothetical protein
MHLGVFWSFHFGLFVISRIMRGVYLLFLVYLLIRKSCWHVGGVCALWVKSATPLSVQSLSSAVFLEAPPRPLPSSVARDNSWWTVCWWWLFLFFLPSFLPPLEKIHVCFLFFSFLFFLNFSPYFFYCLFFSLTLL